MVHGDAGCEMPQLPLTVHLLLMVPPFLNQGIQWLDDVRFVIASDKAKKTQSFKCVAKEQRLSIFALPYSYGGEDK
jgi:hypothetical protein